VSATSRISFRADPDYTIWVPDIAANPAPALVISAEHLPAEHPQLGLTSLDPALLSRITRVGRWGSSWVVTTIGPTSDGAAGVVTRTEPIPKAEAERVIATVHPCRSIPPRMIAGLAATYPQRTSAEPVELIVPPAEWPVIGHLWDRLRPSGCLVRRTPRGAKFCAVLWIDVHGSRRGWSVEPTLAEAQGTEHLVSCTNGAIHSFLGRPRGARQTQVRRAEGLAAEWFPPVVVNPIVIQEFLMAARPRIITDRLRQM
jgi:hypothetical protein